MTELSWYILFGAFVLDMALGDPRWLPHPIIWMGNAISFFEPRFRKWVKNPLVAGGCFAIFLIGITALLSTGGVALALWIHPVLGALVQGILLFYCFSVRSLVTAAREVSRPLMAGDLAQARRMVGMIVGRETHSLDGPAVTRATVETVAENFVDGFLSPLCFALVFGVPGALTYKMINTLDSMVGYRNEKYILFGRVAARMDDVANFIPARISVLVISLAAAIVSPIRGRRALETAWAEGRAHKSPNAGFPEASFAGALGVRMGGPNVYHGEVVEKPHIGSRFPEAGLGKIDRACELMVVSALVGIVAACISSVLAGGLI